LDISNSKQKLKKYSQSFTRDPRTPTNQKESNPFSSNEPISSKSNINNTIIKNFTQAPIDIQNLLVSSLLNVNEYICPISKNIMKNPYATKYGESYEKEYIFEYVASNGVDFVTGMDCKIGEI